MFNVKKYCFREFCDCSNATYEHFISADDCEDHYNEMMNEDWIGDAIDDLCNPMTDSSPLVSMQQMVTGQITVETMNNNNYSSNRVVIIDQRPVVVDQINVDTVVNQSMIDSRTVVVDEINVGSSDTVVIDSDFKSFAIDYFKSGKKYFS
jgi:hypothetical protein